MLYEIILKLGDLSRNEIAKLRAKASREAAKIRKLHPDAKIFLIEKDEKGPGLEKDQKDPKWMEK